MSHSSASNRWVPFHCPMCSGIFRLRKGQVGQCGHCPSCQGVIRTSANEAPANEAPTKVARTKDALVAVEADGSLLDRVAVAKSMTPEEIATQKEVQESLKRKYGGASSETPEWEGRGEEAPKRGLSLQLIWSGVMALVLVLALAVFYVKEMSGGKGSRQGGDKGGVVGSAESHAILNEILNKDPTEIYKDADGVDPTVEVNNLNGEFNMDEVEQVVVSFLNSETVSERLGFVRDPERVGPLMLSHYRGEQIVAEGFEFLDKGQPFFEGDFVTATVQTADFLTTLVSVARIGSGEGAEYRVDWESWVGFCDLSSEEFRSQKPTDPQVMRAVVTASHYYNYGFSDDLKWTSFKLLVKDGEFSFLGYAKRGSAVERSLNDLRTKMSPRFTFKVAYPPNARVPDQVEILEIVSSSWLVKSNNEKNDE